MLKSDHPLSVHIFAAGRLEDAILALSKTVISASASDRHALVANAKTTLDEMRTLNFQHFKGSSFISNTIDDLESALQNLASADRPRLELVLPPLSKLGSAEGFRTDFI